MKNLERALLDFRGERLDTEGAIGAITDSARLDIDAARAEGYRQGVEDAKCKASIDNATSALHRAQLEYARKRPDWKSEALDWMSVFNHITNEAFRGARGVKRAEIRKRLERMEQGK